MKLPGGNMKIIGIGIPVVAIVVVLVGHFTNLPGSKYVKAVTVPAVQFVKRTLKIGQSAGTGA